MGAFFSRVQQIAIVVYTLVFWGALPAALWALALPLDRSLGRWEPSAWGALPVAIGAWLAAASIAELRVRGGGWLLTQIVDPVHRSLRGQPSFCRARAWSQVNVRHATS